MWLKNRQLNALDVLVCFEVELGREALTALGADNGTERMVSTVQCRKGRDVPNLQVDGPNMPLHQTGARLETALAPVYIVPNALGLSTADPLDVLVGVDGRRGASGRGRWGGFVLGRKRGRGGGGWGLRRASGGVRVAREIAAVTGAGWCWLRV